MMMRRFVFFLATTAACFAWILSLSSSSVRAFVVPSPLPIHHQQRTSLTTTSSSSTTTTTTSLAVANGNADGAATNALEQLALYTTLSVDSSDLDLVAKYAATGLITDATTNPALIAQQAAAGTTGATTTGSSSDNNKRYQDFVLDAIMYAKEAMGGGDADLPNPVEELNLAMDKLAVNVGVELTKLVPGKVSTEVDVRLSYDTDKQVERAKRIVRLYQEMGVSSDRVLIKLAGTWEGIQAAKILQAAGINCNITLVFSYLQAAAAAQAGAYLVSPFPGRILDWHKQQQQQQQQQSGKAVSYHPTADPGVLAVKRMVGYLKKYNYPTICMPSSWRSSTGENALDEILALAGVDEMTIPPPLLELLLQQDASVVTKQVDAASEAAVSCDPNFTLTKETWDMYWAVDQCGHDKLKEGIEAFTKDTENTLELLIPQFA